MNEDQYLLFPEDQTITFKVRIRNTGNIALTNLSYAYAVNGTAISPPPGCSGGGSLATSLAKNAAPSYCTFTLPATAIGGSVNDLNVSITAQGLASGVPTGDTSGGATVKVVPRPTSRGERCGPPRTGSATTETRPTGRSATRTRAR